MIKIATIDLAKKVIQENGLKGIEVNNFVVSIEVTPEAKIEEAAKKDPLLAEKMRKAATTEVDKLAAELGKKLKSILAEATKNPDKKDEILDKARTSLAQFKTECQTAIDKAVQAEWEKLKKTNAAYLKYKIKTGVKISYETAKMMVSAGTATGAALVGGVPAAVLGYISVVKSMSKIFQECARLGQEAEVVGVELKDTIDGVMKYYASKNLKEGTIGAREFGIKVWEEITSHQGPSISKCQKELSRFKSKIAGLDVGAHKAAGELDKLIREQEKAEAKMNEIDKKVQAMKTDDKSKQEIAAAKKKIDKNMDELAEATQKTLEFIVESNQRIARCKIGLEKIEPLVKELAEKVPQWSVDAQKFTPLLDFATTTSANSAFTKLVTVAGSVTQNTDLYDKLLEKIAAKAGA